MVTRTETIFRDYDVGTIINVASDVSATRRDLELYSRLDITYLELPIDDTSDSDPPPDFLDRVCAAYEQHVLEKGPRAFLINCQMGINRSAFAAGAVIWRSSPSRSKQPEQVITEMRVEQRAQRGVYLLTNKTFEMALLTWMRA